MLINYWLLLVWRVEFQTERTGVKLLFFHIEPVAVQLCGLCLNHEWLDGRLRLFICFFMRFPWNMIFIYLYILLFNQLFISPICKSNLVSMCYFQIKWFDFYEHVNTPMEDRKYMLWFRNEIFPKYLLCLLKKMTKKFMLNSPFITSYIFLVVVGNAQVLPIILTMAQFHSSAPLKLKQLKGIKLIIYTGAFPTVTCQNICENKTLNTVSS